MYQWFLWLVFVRALPYPSRVDFLSSGKFSDEQLNIIRAHPDVALVTEDGIASIRDTVAQYILIGLRRRIANNVTYLGPMRFGALHDWAKTRGSPSEPQRKLLITTIITTSPQGITSTYIFLVNFTHILLCAVALKGCLDTGVYIDHVRFSLHLVPLSRCLTTN